MDSDWSDRLSAGARLCILRLMELRIDVAVSYRTTFLYVGKGERSMATVATRSNAKVRYEEVCMPRRCMNVTA